MFRNPRTPITAGARPHSLGKAGEELFGARFMEFVIALGKHAHAGEEDTERELDDAHDALIDPQYNSLVGEAVHRAIVNLAEACKATLIDGESVQGDVDELNAALAGQNLAYHIGTGQLRRGGRTLPILYSYAVELVRLYDIGDGAPERVLVAASARPFERAHPQNWQHPRGLIRGRHPPRSRGTTKSTRG